jgi:hypothetical protein
MESLEDKLKEYLQSHNPAAACAMVAEEMNVPTSDVIWAGHFAGLLKREFHYGEQA